MTLLIEAPRIVVRMQRAEPLKEVGSKLPKPASVTVFTAPAEAGQPPFDQNALRAEPTLDLPMQPVSITKVIQFGDATVMQVSPDFTTPTQRSGFTPLMVTEMIFQPRYITTTPVVANPDWIPSEMNGHSRIRRVKKIKNPPGTRGLGRNSIAQKLAEYLRKKQKTPAK